MTEHLAPISSPWPLSTEQTQKEDTKPVDLLLDSSDERKAFATLAARLALKGYALHELSCGGFLISRWDRTAHLSDLSGVRQFLQRIGGEA